MSEPFRAITSASNLLRRKLCPGSPTAERGLPEVGNKVFAETGVMLHDLEFDETKSREELQLIQQRALAKNKRVTEEYIMRVLSLNNIVEQPGDRVTFKEREFFLCDERMEPVAPLVPGHADEIVTFPKYKIVFIFDSKFGRYGVTRADSNLQLAFYTVTAHDDIGGEKFYAAIRQPYLPSPQDFHDVHFLPEDVTAARREILQIIAETQKPDAPRIPSVDACWFCRACGTPNCPESMSFISDIQRAKIMSMRPVELEAMGDVMRMAQTIINNWYERIEYILAHYPQVLKHYELGPQQTVDAIPNPEQALNVMIAQNMFGNVNVDEATTKFLECCKPSIPDLASAIAKAQGITEQNARTAIHALGIVASKPKKRSLRK